jgi:hypothetical protein
MTPSFANLVNPIFLRVLDLEARLQRRERVELRYERADIIKAIRSAEQSVLSPACAVSAEQFELAKRGLIYWIDEIMIEIEPAWQNITLEFEHYAEQNRAVRFYEYGEREVRASQPDVVEVWYLAMALGFQGDIIAAFRYGLKQDPPGGTDDQTRSRIFWARELFRQIQPTQIGKAPQNVQIERSVPPLRGKALLIIALQMLLVSILIVLGFFLFMKAR